MCVLWCADLKAALKSKGLSQNRIKAELKERLEKSLYLKISDQVQKQFSTIPTVLAPYTKETPEPDMSYLPCPSTALNTNSSSKVTSFRTPWNK